MWLKRKPWHDVERFRHEILSDPAVERKFAHCASPTEAIDLAFTLARQRGYRVSRGEVEQILMLPPLEPLSEAELAQIGGGTGNICEYDEEGRNTCSGAAMQRHHARRRQLRPAKA